MAGNGLSVKDIAEIKRLWKLKFSNRRISEITDVHRNTVNKYVAQFALEDRAPAPTALNYELASASAPSDINTVDWIKVRSEFLSCKATTKFGRILSLPPIKNGMFVTEIAS